MRPHAAVILIVAFALSIYNAFEVRRLRGEVVSLRAATARQQPGDPGKDARIRELLGEARQHSARAQELTRKGDLEGARREWQRSLELATEAAEAEGSGETVSQVRDVVGKTAQRVEELFGRLKARKAPENAPSSRKAE
ncbi:MAG: hypothetical protein HY321_16225 [Armatimonadetes bacterium]|nr:hypothetical protein [Armatimonadota bacterium]